MRLTACMMIALAHPCNDLQTLISEWVCGRPVLLCSCFFLVGVSAPYLPLCDYWLRSSVMSH